jgi:hypothetical protein
VRVFRAGAIYTGSPAGFGDRKTEKTCLGHCKMGFFRVKLLPVLVAPGLRLGLAGANPANGKLLFNNNLTIDALALPSGIQNKATL